MKDKGEGGAQGWRHGGTGWREQEGWEERRNNIEIYVQKQTGVLPTRKGVRGM